MNEEIGWRVQTHEHKEHSADWYWGVGLATLLGAAVSIYFGNILLAAIIVIAIGLLALLAIRGPREHEVLINGKGVHIDGTLYRYNNLQSFWVCYDEPLPQYAQERQPRIWLALTTNGYIHPQITVPLDSFDHGNMVREYLLHFIEEQEQHPHFAEHLAELLGF